MYVPVDKSNHYSCDGFWVHALKSADAHRNERLEFITIVGWVHHMETVGEDQVEGKILGEGLCEVCLELLQDVRHVTMVTVWLDLFACEWIVTITKFKTLCFTTTNILYHHTQLQYAYYNMLASYACYMYMLHVHLYFYTCTCTYTFSMITVYLQCILLQSMGLQVSFMGKYLGFPLSWI